MTDFTMRPREKCAAALTRPRALTHRVSVQCCILRTLLVALDLHDSNTPAQDRFQLGVAELRDGAVVDRAAVLDGLHRFAFQAVANLLERPAFARERTRPAPYVRMRPWGVIPRWGVGCRSRCAAIP